MADLSNPASFLPFPPPSVVGKIRSEWDILKNSNVVRGLVAMETTAVVAFIDQAMDGEIPFTFDGLKGWMIAQAALILVLLIRHAIAGIEKQLDGKVPDVVVKAIEAKVQEKALAAIAENHPGAAVVLAKAFDAPEVKVV